MSDFESTLVSALREEAERRTAALDTARAAQVLDARMMHVARARRARTRGWALMAAAAVVVAAVLAAVAGWLSQGPAGVEPAAPPSPSRGIAPGAFPRQDLTHRWNVIGQPAAEPPQLIVCLDDPSGWGAVQTQGVAYGEPSGPGRANEYLLLYADAAQAHASLATLIDDLRRHCGLGSGSAIDHAPGWAWDEAYWNQLVPPFGELSLLRVARAGNIVVVMEESGRALPIDGAQPVLDGSQQVLDEAVRYARGEPHPSSAQPWVSEGTGAASLTPSRSGREAIARMPFPPVYLPYQWKAIGEPRAATPRLTTCMDDPSDWGATQTQGLAYGDQHGTGRANEYVLQYADAAQAYDAYLRATDQFPRCGKADDPGAVDSGQHIPAAYDDGFGNQTLVSPAGKPEVRFRLRVARAGNVLVVLEDLGSPDKVMSDNTSRVLDQAVRYALVRLPDPSPPPWATRSP